MNHFQCYLQQNLKIMHTYKYKHINNKANYNDLKKDNIKKKVVILIQHKRQSHATIKIRKQ